MNTTGGENATLIWEDLSTRVDALIAAWEAGTCPDLREFLPVEPPEVRRLTLVELIKIDLEYRWQDRRAPKRLQEYVAEFPELLGSGDLPSDLIYEEYHVRRQYGDKPDTNEYFRLYPQQAEELRRLLGLESPELTTSLAGGVRADTLSPGDQIDDFDLLARLGQGAFASVFLARQKSMQRIVAVKVSSDRGSEPQTMAQLDHPHIVRVYDQRVVPDQKLRLLYMQHIPGGTLDTVVKHLRTIPRHEWTGKSLLDAVDAVLHTRGESAPVDSLTRRRLAHCTWAEAVCWIGSRLASALQYAHDRGVLHRDVKPANVLVAADATPKLADFNISFSSKVEGATPAAYFGGSLAYMSPEQLEACNPVCERDATSLDGRSDVYSLGVMLWELLTGRRPFPDERIEGNWSGTLTKLAKSRHAGVPSDAVMHLPAVRPVGLKETLLQCLHPDANKRYQSAGQLARQLELCLFPRTQGLLRAHAGGSLRWLRNNPLSALLLVGLLPNVLTSVINIVYNQREIFDTLTPQEQDLFARVQLIYVNGIAYGTATILLVSLLLPILRGVRRVREGESLPRELQTSLRERCLRYGDQVAAISAAGWFISALAFPLWTRLHFGAASQMSRAKFVHLLGSQFLCGLIAATMTFFLITAVMVHIVYPQLVSDGAAGEVEMQPIRRLGQRIWFYFALAVSAPFLSVILLWWIDTNLREAIGVLGAVGLGGFLLAFYLSHVIRNDLSALRVAVAPPGDMGPTDYESDSFWTASR